MRLVTASPPQSKEGKQQVRIAPKSDLSRTAIDCKLTEHNSKQKSPFDQSSKATVGDETLTVDYHWVIDSIYCQRLLPLTVY